MSNHITGLSGVHRVTSGIIQDGIQIREAIYGVCVSDLYTAIHDQTRLPHMLGSALVHHPALVSSMGGLLVRTAAAIMPDSLTLHEHI